MTKCRIEWCIALVAEGYDLCIVHVQHMYWRGPTVEIDPEDESWLNRIVPEEEDDTFIDS